MHAGPTLVSASLSRRFRILRGRRVIPNITSKCVTCRKVTANPRPQIYAQLPVDCVNPGPIFDRVDMDYTGDVLVKYGPVHKPWYKKGYIAAFVCLATKAVHLELLSDLTIKAFIATHWRFIGVGEFQGHSGVIHGTNLLEPKVK